MKYFKWGTYGILSLLLAFSLFFSNTSTSTAATGYQIEINKRTNHLYLYYNGKVVETYRVATGKSSKLTPTGVFKIGFKTVKPGWNGIPGGYPNNPLGERWLGLRVNGDNARVYGIHGTNQPSSIGSHASKGCVRMHNRDVIKLYNKIPLGTSVWIHSGYSNGFWLGKDNKIGKAKVIISSGYLNIRTGPSTKYSIITRVKKGTILKKLGSTNGWVKVQLGHGRVGYVSQSYVHVYY